MRAGDATVQIARLVEKYRLLSELAARRAQLEAAGRDRFEARESSARRRAFRTLAREFPGALRELDAMPADVLATRHEAVRTLAAAPPHSLLPLWMELAIAYHAETREALAIKRWLAQHLPRGEALDADVHEAFCAWYARWPQRLRDAEAVSLELLARHLWPPQGRVQAVVWEALEARFARPRNEIERLLFGTAPQVR